MESGVGERCIDTGHMYAANSEQAMPVNGSGFPAGCITAGTSAVFCSSICAITTVSCSW